MSILIIIFFIIASASFLFAMLGLGGGMVYVPVLTWAGMDIKEVAIPLGLLLNGLNTLLALIPFSRKKLVDWKGGAVMAVAATVASPVGAYISQYVPTNMLLIAFALMVLAAAARMAYSAGKAESSQKMSLKKRSLAGLFTGSFAGFSGGMLGLGGGFIIAPVLIWLGYKAKEAAATTAFVVTFSSASGYLGHMAQGEIDWLFTGGMVLAVIIGSQLGGHFMAGRAKSRDVKRIYAVVLAVIALKLLWDVFG